LADSAKVDRAALVDLLEVRLARAAMSEAGEEGLTPAERVLGAFRVALAEPELPADADFLAAGGDSLRAVSLVAALRTSLGVTVGVQDLLEHPTAAAMTAFVGRQRATPGVPPDEQAAMDADALAPLAGPLHPAAAGSVRTVLLTGGTGFVGAQLAYELLARTDTTVLCLARAGDDREARQRVLDALTQRRLWWPGWGHRLVGVAGSLDQPNLGLTAERWSWLAGQADAVLHAGAVVNFLYDYRAHRGANVLGTTELLRLTQQGRPVPLHHVSTLGVLDREAALHDGPMPEDVDPERVRPPETGYSRSKWVAERLLARARQAGGTVTVLRLGEVMPAATGPANPRALTHLLLTAFAELGACPDVALCSDYTPVDWAARIAVAALFDPAVQGRDLHVLHPQSVCLTSVLPRAGVPLERVAPDEFRRRVEEAADTGGPAELATLAGILRRLPGELDRMVVDNPSLFRAEAAAKLAARSGICTPDLGRAICGYAGELVARAEETTCASG
jgi:thioester reductase-like protein